jgi:hypothetical protein
MLEVLVSVVFGEKSFSGRWGAAEYSLWSVLLVVGSGALVFGSC